MKKSEKPLVVDDLTARIKDAKSVTVVDYQGLATKNLGELRAKIKDVGGIFLVAKNTLVKLALKKSKVKVESKIDKGLTGPTAVVFAMEDEIGPLQVLGQAQKENDLPKLKFGIFDAEILDGEKLLALSRLPAKNILFGQLVGSIAGPAYSLVATLQANMQNLVFVLQSAAQNTSKSKQISANKSE